MEHGFTLSNIYFHAAQVVSSHTHVKLNTNYDAAKTVQVYMHI